MRHLRHSKLPPRALSVAEEDRFLNAARAAGPRLLALALTLLRTGLRVSEANALRTDQVLYLGEVLRTWTLEPNQAKGGQGRLVEVPQDARLALWEYLTTRFTNLLEITPPRPLFANARNPRAIGTRGIQRAIAHLCHTAQIPDCTPHTLRHTLATRLVRVASIDVAAKALGHADIRTTQLYTHPSGDEVHDAIEKLSTSS